MKKPETKAVAKKDDWGFPKAKAAEKDTGVTKPLAKDADWKAPETKTVTSTVHPVNPQPMVSVGPESDEGGVTNPSSPNFDYRGRDADTRDKRAVSGNADLDRMDRPHAADQPGPAPNDQMQDSSTAATRESPAKRSLGAREHTRDGEHPKDGQIVMVRLADGSIMRAMYRRETDRPGGTYYTQPTPRAEFSMQQPTVTTWQDEPDMTVPAKA